MGMNTLADSVLPVGAGRLPPVNGGNLVSDGFVDSLFIGVRYLVSASEDGTWQIPFNLITSPQ